MLKTITSILKSKLVDWESSKTIGVVSNWVVDPVQKKISALIVNPPGIFKKTLVVTTTDVVEYGPGMVVVRNQNTIVPVQEVVGLDKLVKNKQRIIGCEVVTQSGKRLGVTEDLLFETTDSTIQKIYIHPRILDILKSHDLIIGADKIVEIKPKRIIVRDDALDGSIKEFIRSNAIS
ncbi:PRC-barrel domain-containing protein [Patescibacteria group bacterium]|nr:PRC-barrel domain-containing protein [Patescibacteria group bacterium]